MRNPPLLPTDAGEWLNDREREIFAEILTARPWLLQSDRTITEMAARLSYEVETGKATDEVQQTYRRVMALIRNPDEPAVRSVK